MTRWKVVVERDCPIAMSDGTLLRADVYRPDALGRFPTLLQRTPYGKANGGQLNYAHASWYAAQGFAVAVQDVRGRWGSDGTFSPFQTETEDGAASIAWAANLPFGNGKVGTYGFSYCGLTQLRAASSSPPGLRAVAPAMLAGSDRRDWIFSGGGLRLAFVLGWAAFLAYDQAVRARDDAAAEELDVLRNNTLALCMRLPIRGNLPAVLAHHAPFLEDWLRQQPLPAMRSNATIGNIPALHIAGWHDTFLEGTLAMHEEAAGHSEQHLLIGPWVHSPWSRAIGQLDFGQAALSDIDDIQLTFFRRHLAGWQPDEGYHLPAVRYFLMGANRWQEAPAWPPPGIRPRIFFLASDGRAQSAKGGELLPEAGSEVSSDTFASNPHVPVYSVGGRGNGDPAYMGPFDQSVVETRSDTATYTTTPLDEDVVVIGAPALELCVGTDAPSIDLVARLSDVDRQGRSIPVSDAARRVLPAELRPGSVLRVPLSMSPTAHCFKAGHRLRLTIAGSDFPLRDRNPQDGSNPLDATWSNFRIASVTLFHDADNASRLTLPIARPG
jgi:putative CocE/NonD family hydrolase